MTKSESIEAFLAHANIVDALFADMGDAVDVVALLNDVTSLSEHYIPTLQFLMRPDNITSLVQNILQEPSSAAMTASSRTINAADQSPSLGERPAPGGGEFPCYDQYVHVFRAQWVLCASGFAPQLISALVALQSEPRDVICRAIIACDSRDTMILEALARFLHAFMDQYSPESLLGFFGDTHSAALLETLLVLNCCESIRDVLLRIFNDTNASVTALHGATTQLLHQLAPMAVVHLPPLQRTDASAFEHRIAADALHLRFARMLFTCDLVTDLIHERRTGSIGFYYVDALASRAELANWLLAAALFDLETLPSAFANESYALKVLNSLLQQSQCGCVTKAAFLSASSSNNSASNDEDGEFTQGSPHEDLPLVWKQFIAQLPAFLAVLQLPRARRCPFKNVHVQTIYLMLPILNVSCTAVDAHLRRTETLECVLDLVLRFPAANILHCAIARLFIVVLEDSPFMFGKELPAYRAANDPLRLHLLLQGCLDTVLNAFDVARQTDATLPCSITKRPPPALLDIAISFDQALTSAHAHSPHLFAIDRIAAWHAFRTTVLLPTQQIWEAQYEPHEAAAAAATSPLKSTQRFSGAELVDPESEMLIPVQTAQSDAEEAERVAMLQRAITAATLGDSREPTEQQTQEVPAANAAASADAAEKLSTEARPATHPLDDDAPTPLAALYNDEEKDMMRNVVTATASTSA